jgi:hypothetical protein
MIDVAKLMRDEKSVAFLSFLIGLGTVILFFHKPFSSRQFLSLPVNQIEGQVIKHGDKCYTYSTEDSLCPSVNKDGRSNRFERPSRQRSGSESHSPSVYDVRPYSDRGINTFH